MAGFVPFLLAPLRAQALGPDGRGEFAFFQASLSVIAAVSALGVRHAYYLHVVNSSDRYSLRGSRFNLVTTSFGLVAGVPLSLIAYNSISALCGIAVFVVAMGGSIYATVQIEVANAQQKALRSRIGALAAVPAPVEVVGSVLLLILERLTATTAMITTIFAEIFRSFVAQWLRRRDKRLTRNSDLDLAQRFMKSAIKFAPATLVPLLVVNIDSLIYGALLPISYVGLYAVAKIATTVLLLGAATMEGKFLRSVQKCGIGRTVGISTLVLIPIGVLVAFTGFALVPPLFGAAFSAAAAAFPLTAVAGVFGAFYVWTSAACAQGGLYRSSFISALIVLGFISLGSIVVSNIGAVGVTIMGWPLVAAYFGGIIVTSVSLARRWSRIK